MDVKQERRIDDYLHIDGSRDLSDSWTGFTQFTFFGRETSTQIYVVRVETDKKAVDIQGSSASQMTATKVMDIISRLPGCAGQAADAVSVYTQVKMEDAPKLLKIPSSDCPDIWIRLPRHKWPKSWSSMEDPVVLLERNRYGHHLEGLFWERQFEKILLQHGW